MSEKPFAPATARNRHAILGVMAHELASSNEVLEIGSGTGQHAVCFGRALPQLTWQTSDRSENHAGINAWLADASLENVLPPLDLDVRTATIEKGRYDAVYSANTAHIMGIDAVEKMFELVATGLRKVGVFVLYGPFRQGGKFNTDSNAAFDRSLRSTDSEMGIRDIELLDTFAAAGNLRRVRLYAMPANNHIAVWHREEYGAVE